MRRFLIMSAVFVLCTPAVPAADKDTDKAAATRKKLQTKISVNYKDTVWNEVKDDLKSQVPSGIGIREDTKSGVTLNSKFTYSAKDKTLEEVLDELLAKQEWGYYVISKQGDTYDGSIMITKGKERGYPAGQEIAKKPDDKKPDDKKPDDKKTDDKKKPDDKKADDKKHDDKKADPPKAATDDTPDDRAERAAAAKFRAVKKLVDEGMKDRAIEACEEILKDHPNTKTAEEAKKLLEKLDK
jgi:hypothetical protein